MTENQISAAKYTGVHLDNLAGDLSVQTWDKGEILVTSDSEISVMDEGEILHITCERVCRLQLPEDFSLRFQRIGGDVVITDLAGDLAGDKIGGDLRLEQVATVRVESVGGDVSVTKLSGNLALGSVGGDLSVDESMGDVNATVAGDLAILHAMGAIAATCGGDSRLQLESVDGGHAIQAGGDISCHLPPSADVTLNLQYGGTLRSKGRQVESSGASHLSRIVLGQGEATLNLIAGGDIHFDADLNVAPEPETVNPEWRGEDLSRQVEDVTANLSAQMSQLSEQLSKQLGGLSIGDDVAEKIQRSIDKTIRHAERKINHAVHVAERKAVRAQQRAEKRKSFAGPPPRPHVKPMPSAPADPAGDEERAAVLRMLEEGKLSAEQADELLSAMKA